MDDKVYLARRRGLRIVLVLSFIGSGLSFFSYLMMSVGLSGFQAMYSSGQMVLPGEMTVFVEQLMETPRSFFVCSSLLYAMSLVGLVMMWNVRRNGFHMYTMAQLLLLLVTVLFLGRERLALGDVMMTLLFVVYYFMAMRQLDSLKQQQTADEKIDSDNTPQ
ncbi:MAG: hypothetical protein IJP80_04550 [Bacteroidales bacterium]|nr:hypothetical protein [Bacteroidales bacterium]